jgi:hypothetical protein
MEGDDLRNLKDHLKSSPIRMPLESGSANTTRKASRSNIPSL